MSKQFKESHSKKNNSSKVYSGLDSIPNGTASGKITQGCLVLEGGAFRGLYSQGYMDALMLNDINLSCTIGVSAGALGGMNYVSGQIGRSARINLGFRHDSRYVGVKAFLHSKSILDIGFLTEDRKILEPFDMQAFNSPGRRFVAVATDCVTGQPAYFEKETCDIMQAVRASATMPYISHMVRIDGRPYYDGGCSCKIPYKWALEQGFEKILLIRTRDITHRRKEKVGKSAYRLYPRYPEFADSQAHSNINANRQCDEIDRLHEVGKLYRVAPSEPVTVGRIESDMEKLGDLYWLGYNDCVRELPKLKKYLGIE